MAKVIFQDEEGQNLNRYKMTPVVGQDNTFDLERVANITKQGTPIGKATLDRLVQDEDLAAHTGDTTVHVTQADHDKINGAVPSTLKINGHALNLDITLTAADVGAVPASASCNKAWNWSGQNGQPSWLWGSNDGANMYVYNPANFSVNLAANAHYSSHAVGSSGAALRNNTATVGGSPSGGSDGDGWDICT